MQNEITNAQAHARPIVSRMLRHHREDTEDVLQQTSLQVWRKRETFRGDSSFSTWYTSCAIRFCLMKLRRKTYRTASLDDAFPVADHSPNPERRTIARDAVSKILPLLTKEQRTTFRLLAMGFNMQEISKANGRTIGSTKAAIHRARKNVQEKLRTGFEE